MNENRFQAYLNLIEELLNTFSAEVLASLHSDKEQFDTQVISQVMENLASRAAIRAFKILDVNRNLIDPDLISIMKISALYQAQEGYLGAADFLNNLADDLAREHGLLSSTNTSTLSFPQSESQLDLFFKILNTISENYPENLQAIYSVMQENIDKFDDDFATIIQNWGKETLLQTEIKEARYVASNIVLFGNLIQDFSLGISANNVEIAIACFKLYTTVFSREVDSLAWAEVQYNLGNAYLKRVKGKKADNIEVAIKYYLASLEIRNSEFHTSKDIALQWADTKHNLGNAYLARIHGDRAENLETAIHCFFQELEIYDEEWFPTPERFIAAAGGIAKALENLSSISALYRLTSIKSQFYFLLEILIVFFALGFNQQNLEIAHPLLQTNEDKLDNNFVKLLQRWGTDTLSNAKPEHIQLIASSLILFSNHLLRIPLGSRCSKVEIAIVGYEIAATVFTHNTYPEQWAGIQGGLGNAYCEKFQGDRAENLELAIKHYKLALQIIMPERFPQVWGTIQNNLATAYIERIRGERAENIDLAITACELGLQFCKPETFPKEWGRIKYNLGNAYGKRIRGDFAENIELAIAAYKDALQVRTHETLPEEWAMTQNSLGEAYRTRKYGNPSQNLEKALTAYKSALHWSLD